MTRTLFKNFLVMPSQLKLVAAIALFFPVFILLSVWPGATISAFGRPLTVAAWWASGGGPFTVIVGVLLLGSGVLMLTRSPGARLFYIASLGLMILSIAVVGSSLAVPKADIIVACVSNTVIVAIVAAYLYGSRAVRDYFGGQ